MSASVWQSRKYHISVFGSPPRRAATAGGRMHLHRKPLLRVEQLEQQRKPRRLRRAAAENLLPVGRPQLVQRPPAHGPRCTTLCASSRSTISHDSPIRTPGGSRLPNSVSSRRPPQTRSMNSGSKTIGSVSFMFYCAGAA